MPRSWLSRVFAPSLLRRLTAIGLTALLVAAAWRYFPRSITLYTPMVGETFVVGTPVLLDDDVVGRISAIRGEGEGRAAELSLRWLSSGQKQKLKDGLVRVAGLRMIWLTSEFIDVAGPPLVEGDYVPVISRAERDSRKTIGSLLSWMIPGSGLGLLWLLWRGISRRFA